MARKPKKSTLRNKLDWTWRMVVRERADWTCERCPRSRSLGFVIHAHHTIGRTNLRLRWDLRNGVALCFSCHGWAGDNPDEQMEWRATYRPEDLAYCKRVRNEITHYTVSDYAEMLADLKAELELELAA